MRVRVGGRVADSNCNPNPNPNPDHEQGVLLNSDELYAPTGPEVVEQSVKLMLLLDLCGQVRVVRVRVRVRVPVGVGVQDWGSGWSSG